MLSQGGRSTAHAPTAPCHLDVPASYTSTNNYSQTRADVAVHVHTSACMYIYTRGSTQYGDTYMPVSTPRIRGNKKVRTLLFVRKPTNWEKGQQGTCECVQSELFH